MRIFIAKQINIHGEIFKTACSQCPVLLEHPIKFLPGKSQCFYSRQCLRSYGSLYFEFGILASRKYGTFAVKKEDLVMPVFMFDKSFGNTGLYIVDIPDRLTQIPEHITLVKDTEPVGSSANRSLGLLTMALAQAQRCFWPPDT